ncbi:LysR family transcriptional regulator [Halomonas sp. 328]|uniref:LysR family transcriptional regulator n=1 Tax=Halomonas sp. 328 TaxID=2776704 RepID=UPI0018A76371|nr:LysR family transcriptional regulator [Halomonas sp. 328]MBF8221053.1 LysR family transcriptional regulator [Halomonas sp. 328]
MHRHQLPLNALRAFEASARHGSFTGAANELCVSQAAVSHQVRQLEAQLGVALFRRLPRGLSLSGEGELLFPVLNEALDRLAQTLDSLADGARREILRLGVVGTFAACWLLPRLADFHQRFPFIEVRVATHNNRVELAAEGYDMAIRYGSGAWHGESAIHLMEAPLSVLCSPRVARELHGPADVLTQTLFRSFRSDEWQTWLAAAGVDPYRRLPESVMLDSSLAMMEAVVQGSGVALVPIPMFERHLASGAIVQPFDIQVTLGSYWLTRLQSHPESAGMALFRRWLLEEAHASAMAAPESR